MPDAEHRTHRRDSLLLMAQCTLPASHAEQRVKVRNISASGLMAEGPLHPPVGATVIIDLRNIGPVEGTVAWALDTRFGIAFAQPIDPQLVRQASQFTPPADTDQRSYYQRGPVGTISRSDMQRKDRLRLI